ncbi:MAG: ATP-binding cassette domain-containing protein [Burkholderiales bacterium]|nr:ABC transporter ATP-binding protein [Burkholderiales bacterium]MDQ3195707.1 ABC transporter ATP-binding protein [Pseudomonadota bacterium]
MTAAIEIEGVVKRYGALTALGGIDLGIAEGEFFGLLGPNGAGKTTLINLLAGLSLADSGTLAVMGFDVVRRYRGARRRLGVVPQELVFDPFFTVREALTIQSGYFGIRDNRGWIDEIIHHLDLAGKADTNMRALSGGMKRRVLIAQALVHKPPVIVLDEPTAGVDVALRQTLWSFIRKLNRDGHTIVLTTHYLEEAEILCSRIAMLKHGAIVALDSTQNLLNSVSGRRLKMWLKPNELPPALQPMQIARGEKSFTLKIEDYSEIERVMAELRMAGITVQELELQQPDLEDVFMQIMSRQ